MPNEMQCAKIGQPLRVIDKLSLTQRTCKTRSALQILIRTGPNQDTAT